MLFTNGQIRVYFDSELTLQATNNVTTTLEKLFIGSFKGDTGFDNIIINTTPSTPAPTPTTSNDTNGGSTPAFELVFVVPIIVNFSSKNPIDKFFSKLRNSDPKP
ncbi:MAG: hypothetical protein JSW11_07015 [Candidatus Heimdallarchaeota archaeon]|nr:MAG: hypothetical protein JSW11_07015 [Candidatus Heimdallarchaeota archaeon]